MQGRPRRSVLYMPGSNERALEKAKTIAADALIFDLEDSVPVSAKLTGVKSGFTYTIPANAIVVLTLETR